ncbi:MAG: CDP-diacylglycerol--serine O-phosphatidyltransferase [Longimicrobiales bacterium]
MRTPRAPTRQTLQRGVVILPSAFTLGNLFFGVYAIVSASRGDFIWAAWYVVFAGVLDVLDGSVARFTRTGSRFGAELDSLVDAISFGVAPGFIMYRVFFEAQGYWVLSFVYVTAVVVRLARFNIEQSGEAKRYFHGLPSPAAGMTLACFYPWSQTPFFNAYFSDLPWQDIWAVGVVLVGVLLVSHVPYARFPKIGLRTPKGIFNTVVVLAGLFAAIAMPRYFLFSVGLLYIIWGLFKSVILGLLDRLPGGDPLLEEDDEEEGEHALAEVRSLDYTELRAEPRAGPRNAPPNEGPRVEEDRA